MINTDIDQNEEQEMEDEREEKEKVHQTLMYKTIAWNMKKKS